MKNNSQNHYSIFLKDGKEILKIEGNPNLALNYVTENNISWDIINTYSLDTNEFIISMTFEEFQE